MNYPYSAVDKYLVDQPDVEALKNCNIHVSRSTQILLALKLLRGEIIVENLSTLRYKVMRVLNFWYLVILIVFTNIILANNLDGACQLATFLYHFIHMGFLCYTNTLDQVIVAWFNVMVLSLFNLRRQIGHRRSLLLTLSYGYRLPDDYLQDLQKEFYYNNILLSLNIGTMCCLVITIVLSKLLDNMRRRRGRVAYSFKKLLEKTKAIDTSAVGSCIDRETSMVCSPSENEKENQSITSNEEESDGEESYTSNEKTRSDGLITYSLV